MIELEVLAGEAHIVAGEHGPAHLNRLLQHVQADSVGRIVDAERPMLDVVPRPADTQDGPALRDDVQRRHDLGQDARVAVGDARDKRAELHPLGQRGQRP